MQEAPIYDLWVLGFSNRLAWRCPTTRLLAHYDAHVGARHLDVGPGSGYYLRRCRFPTARPELTLLDLNANSLRAASSAVAHLEPALLCADVLEPVSLAPGSFDSVALNFVIHCLPGTLEGKGLALDHLRPLLRPSGVLFGSTILGRGVPLNPVARALTRVYNAKYVFSNATDDLESLERELDRRFEQVKVELVGAVALFSARV